jgi:hypothetical protein
VTWYQEFTWQFWQPILILVGVCLALYAIRRLLDQLTAHLDELARHGITDIRGAGGENFGSSQNAKRDEARTSKATARAIPKKWARVTPSKNSLIAAYESKPDR